LRCNKHIQVLNISYTTRETKTITMRKSIACGLLLAAVIAVCFDLNDATCGRKCTFIYMPVEVLKMFLYIGCKFRIGNKMLINVKLNC